METYNALENSIIDVANGKVIKKNKNRLSSLIFIIAGIALMGVNTKQFSLLENSTVTSLLFFVGLVLAIWGIISLFIKKEQYIYTNTGKNLKKYSLEFDLHEFEKMNKLYRNKQFREIAELKKNEQTPGLILKLIGTENGDIYFSQLLKYIPYSFVPITECQEHDSETCKEIKQLISIYDKK